MRFHWKHWLLGTGAVALAIAVGAGATLSAQNTNPGHPPFRGGMMGPGGPGLPGPGGPLGLLLGRAADRLGLTDDQKAQIKSIAESHKSEMQSAMQAVGQSRRTLLLAQLAGQADDQIRQLSGQVAVAEANAAVAETHVLSAVMQVLTADQQAQITQMVQNGPRGRGGRR